jgi:predicted outer membrane protein
MRAKLFHTAAAGALALVALWAATAFAQQQDQTNPPATQNQPGQTTAQNQPGQTTTPSQPGQVNPSAPTTLSNQTPQGATPNQPAQATGEVAPTDRLLAAGLLIANEGEIAMNRAAEQRTQNEQVRRFAQHMVQDHGVLVTQLQPLAGDLLQAAGVNFATGSPAAAQNQPVQPRSMPVEQPAAQLSPQAATTGAISAETPNLALLRTKYESGMQQVANQSRWLDSLPQPLFELWFMTGQVLAHQRMLADLQVAHAHASPQLQPQLNQAIQSTQEHLQEALQVLGQLDVQAGISTAQHPNLLR